LGKVETEEEELDSIAHLDVIAADGGGPPASNGAQHRARILSVTARLVNRDEAKGAWQLEKIEEVNKRGANTPSNSNPANIPRNQKSAPTSPAATKVARRAPPQ
jgi:hypothetical protein